MANEFIIKHGFHSKGNSEVTGSLKVTEGISGSFSGSFQGDGSALTGISSGGAYGISNSNGVYTYYATLSASIAAASTGDVVEVFADVTETNPVTILFKNGVNIQGNGHKYTLDHSSSIASFADYLSRETSGTSISSSINNLQIDRINGDASTGLRAATIYINNDTANHDTFLDLRGSEISNNAGATYFCSYRHGRVLGGKFIGNHSGAYFVSSAQVQSTGTHNVTDVYCESQDGYAQVDDAGDSTFVSKNNTAAVVTQGDFVGCTFVSNATSPDYNGAAVVQATSISGAKLKNCVAWCNGSGTTAVYGVAWIENCSIVNARYYALNYAIDTGGAQSFTLLNSSVYSNAGSAIKIQDGSNTGTLRILNNTIHNDRYSTYGAYPTIYLQGWDNSDNLIANNTIVHGGPYKDGNLANAIEVYSGGGSNYTFNIVNNTIKVSQHDAFCISSSAAVAPNIVYAQNTFEGANVPIAPSITQALTNIPDAQGNIHVTSSLNNDRIYSGSFSGSYVGDGSGLTGVDAFPFSGDAQITGSLNVSGSTTISLPSGSAFSVIEEDAEATHENRLDFAYTQQDPTLTISARGANSVLHLKTAGSSTGTTFNSSGEIIRNVSGVNYGIQLGPAFKPVAGNQQDLGFYNRRWKNLYINTGDKISFGVNDTSNIDLASLRHLSGTNTLQISGSSDVILDVKGVVSASKFTANSGSSANLPGYSFHHSSGTGLYSQGAGYLQLQVNGGGTPEFELTTGQATFRVPIQLTNNELINPSRIRGIGSITGSTTGNNLGVSASLDLVGNLSISKTTGGPDPGDGSTVTYLVTVADSGGSKFYINKQDGSGAVLHPDIVLLAGNTYRFDTSNGTNNTHPFAFRLASDSSTSYTTGVTVNGNGYSSPDPGQAGAYVDLAVTSNTPNLIYYCTSHGNGMGGGAIISVQSGSLNTMAGIAKITGSLNVTGSTNIVGSLTATTISGDGSALTNIIPNNTVSSSAQVKTFLPTGTVSSSVQISASAAASGFGSGGGGGTTVVANPGSSGGGALSTIGIGGTNFSVSSGGSGIFSDSNGFKLTNNNLIVSKSAAGALTSSLSVQGSGSSILEVKGSAGQLFDVQDGLDGVLMSVNDISGIPILTVSSSGNVILAQGSNLIGTASVALNVPGVTSAFPFTGNALIKGELDITGSGDDIFRVRSSSGSLFSVDDGLDGVLMSVNDISGLPLFEISSSGDVRLVEGNISGSAAFTASFGHLIVNGVAITGSGGGGGGGGTSVVANPGSSGAGALSTIGIGGSNFSVGGSSGASIDTGSLGSTTITGSLIVSESIVNFASASSVLLPEATVPLINPQVKYFTTTEITSSGDIITLPDGLTFVSSSAFEYLEIFINGLRLRYDIDFAPRSTSTVEYFTTLPVGTEVTYKSLRR